MEHLSIQGISPQKIGSNKSLLNAKAHAQTQKATITDYNNSIQQYKQPNQSSNKIIGEPNDFSTAIKPMVRQSKSAKKKSPRFRKLQQARSGLTAPHQQHHMETHGHQTIESMKHDSQQLPVQYENSEEMRAAYSMQPAYVPQSPQPTNTNQHIKQNYQRGNIYSVSGNHFVKNGEIYSSQSYKMTQPTTTLEHISSYGGNRTIVFSQQQNYGQNFEEQAQTAIHQNNHNNNYFNDYIGKGMSRNDINQSGMRKAAKSEEGRNYRGPNKQNPAQSLLLNVLNLKQLQKQQEQSIHYDNDYSMPGYSPEHNKMVNQIQSHKLSSSMNKFFQKRDQTKTNRDNQKLIDQIKNSRNGNSIHSFNTQYSRKDHSFQQKLSIFEQLGINNTVYGLQNPRTGQNINEKSAVSLLTQNIPGKPTKQLKHNTSGSKQNLNKSTNDTSMGIASAPNGMTTENSPQKRITNPYEKREADFQKLYQTKLNELRLNSNYNDNNKESSAIKTTPNPDISLYKERQDSYRVISNRIKTRAQMADRKYIDKNVKVLEKFFDPLRIRLRVLPSARAPNTIGKNSDYYFLEASKLSLKGDLPSAIEMLKKGLELKPNHFLCRFNHGVLLFKLGLIQEAKEDFETLVKNNQKEPLSAYNLAICCIQVGQYSRAIELCDLVLQNIQNDTILKFDAYKLKGICLYRIGDSVESIKNYAQANRIRPEVERILKEQQKQELTLQQLEYIYINLFIEETKLIFSDVQFQKKIMKVSRSQSNLKPLLSNFEHFKRFGSEKNLHVKSQKDYSRLKHQRLISHAQRQSLMQDSKVDTEPFLNIVSEIDSLDFNEQRPYANSISKVDRSNLNQGGITSPIKKSTFRKQHTSVQSPNNKHRKGAGGHHRLHVTSTLVQGDPRDKSNDKRSVISYASQVERARLKNYVGIQSPEKNELDEKAYMKLMEDQFYQQFKAIVSNYVDAGTSMRYDKIYSANPDTEKDMTTEEVNEINKRKQLETYLYDKKQLSQLQQQQNDDKFLQFLMQANELGIKEKEVAGTKNDQTISQGISQQKELNDMLENLRQKFIQHQMEWDKEFQQTIDEMNDVSQVHDEMDDLMNKRNKESVIDKLNKSLADSEVTPDDVQNILIREREEKARLESVQMSKNPKSIKRLTLRQVEAIKKEFSVESGERDTKVLDKIMKELKFFKRFDDDVRKKIYLNAELVSLAGHQVIFNQGDVGDKLYVILKGRVAVQINSPDYGNLPVVVATLNDGEQFGELSLISLSKLQDNSKQGEIQNLSDIKQSTEQFARRKATCLTVEQCDLLAIPKEISVELYQPDAVAKSQSSKARQSRRGNINTHHIQQKSKMSSAFDYVTQDDKDELNRKIAFLQSLPLFDDIDAQLLMPIACNMMPYSYSFGEYIIKEGEIPKGLVIIKSGQCKVASTRIAGRPFKGNYDLNKKLGDKKRINDPHPLFNEYDPDNSLLNEVKSLKRGFQNDRIYVNENGEQIKGKIVYQDILVFSQLMPKNYFGGRVLLPFEMLMGLKKMYFGQDALIREYPRTISQQFIDQESDEQYHLKSFLSVIADSGTVDVYILDKQDMSYIPDFILRKVYEKIAVLREPDRPFAWPIIEEVKEQMIRWENFKVNCVRKMFRDKVQENNYKAR